MRKTHVILDFDGVICDSLDSCIQWFNRIRRERFPQLPEVNSRHDMVTVYAGPLKASLASWLTGEESEAFFNLHSAGMATEASTLATFPGIAAAMATLGPASCSIVTSAYSEAVLAILRSDPFFDEGCLHTVAGRELRQSKTDKIRAILAELGLSAEDAIYVGDLESDILYCRQVPIDIICVGYGYHPATYLKDKEATYMVETVSELCTLLSGLMEFRPTPADAV